MFVNGGAIPWDNSSQVGPETPLLNPWSNPFAVHVLDVTNAEQIEDSVLTIDFPYQQFYSNAWNWGWWSVYLVILYEAPEVTTPVCVRLYTADQNQDFLQSYSISTPSYVDNTPILFSLFAARQPGLTGDETRVWINDQVTGKAMKPQPTEKPLTTSGQF
jgi:hypothetical protein